MAARLSFDERCVPWSGWEPAGQNETTQGGLPNHPQVQTSMLPRHTQPVIQNHKPTARQPPHENRPVRPALPKRP